MKCNYGIKNFKKSIEANKNNVNEIVLSTEYDFSKLHNDNIKKLKRLFTSLMIRRIHVHIFLLLTLIFCITAISLLGDYKINYHYLNDSYIIFGVAFGTFLAAMLFVIISVLTLIKIFKLTKGKYEILHELISAHILDENTNKYSLGIQMAFSSRYIWNTTSDIRWNNMYVAVAIASLFDELSRIKNPIN